jgi:dihydroorotate dehydrogenase electron transfer subunit
MRHLHAVIVRHEPIAPGHFCLTLRASEIAAHSRAGQFVHVLPRAAATFDPLLRRAFSITAVREDEFDIIYRVEGRGTALLAQHLAGETLDILGPLGQPFQVETGPMILVGGGVGVPPLARLAQQERGQDSNRNIHALLGARSRDDLLCQDEFKTYGVAVSAATDDGSAGIHGRVTHLLDELLAEPRFVHDKPAVYACGPLPMLRAVADICARTAIRCQVSLEENMPCGVGVCNGCVVETRDPGDDYGKYRRICVDGPVIPAHEIAW